MFSLLIKDTTRAQREEIVRRSLKAAGDALRRPPLAHCCSCS